MTEFITLGEPLVVFCSTQADCSIEDVTNFNKVIGGAELNVAIGVQRLGHSSEYVSQVGADPQGEFIQKRIKASHIDVNNLKQSKKYFTGYQMKQLVTNGDPYVFNFRKNYAASHLTPKDVSSIDLKGVKFAHLTGILAATSEKAKKASETFARRINEANIILTFDPNLRPAMWPDKEKMITTINYLAKYADIVLPGQNEGKILVGSDDPEKIADFYLNNGQTKIVFVKTGAKGVYFKTKMGNAAFVPGFNVKKVVDTVGAGDGFAVGIITALMEGKNYVQAAKRGNAIGAMQVQTHGDNDGYPTYNQLIDFYKEYGVIQNDVVKV